jgi:hypothetical protein
MSRIKFGCSSKLFSKTGPKLLSDQGHSRSLCKGQGYSKSTSFVKQIHFCQHCFNFNAYCACHSWSSSLITSQFGEHPSVLLIFLLLIVLSFWSWSFMLLIMLMLHIFLTLMQKIFPSNLFELCTIFVHI